MTGHAGRHAAHKLHLSTGASRCSRLVITRTCRFDSIAVDTCAMDASRKRRNHQERPLCFDTARTSPWQPQQLPRVCWDSSFSARSLPCSAKLVSIFCSRQLFIFGNSRLRNHTTDWLFLCVSQCMNFPVRTFTVTTSFSGAHVHTHAWLQLWCWASMHNSAETSAQFHVLNIVSTCCT